MNFCYTVSMTTPGIIKTVILDFDDTMYLSEEACFFLENEVLRRMGREPQKRDVHLATWGMQVEAAMHQRSPGIDIADFWKTMNMTHAEFVKDGRIDTLADHTLRTLDELASVGYELFVLTSRTKSEVIHLLDPSHHLSGRVTHIYHADETGHIKPDPRVFDKLFASHDASPETSVYVGDSPSDGHAANGAGMKFIASFEAGIRTLDDFADVQIDATINHFTELPETIKNLR